MKLGDIELDSLQEAVLPCNLVNWVKDKVVNELAEKAVAERGDEVIAQIKIDQAELREKVMDKLADKIIDEWGRNYDH